MKKIIVGLAVVVLLFSATVYVLNSGSEGDVDADVSDFTVNGEGYASFADAIVAAKSLETDEKRIVFNTDNLRFERATTGLDDYGFVDGYDVSGLIIDLNKKMVIVEKEGLTLKGANFTVCNGTITAEDGVDYALFTKYHYAEGDEAYLSENVVLENLTLNGGLNLWMTYNVVIKGLTVTGRSYYSVWCDEYADVSIEGGSYRTNGYAVIAGFDCDSSMQVGGGTFEITNNQPLVYVGNRSLDPVITGGFFYGDGANSVEISKYVPDGYRVIEATYGGIHGFEVVPVGTLVTVTIDVQGDGSVDSMGLKVLEGTEISVEDNVLTIGDRVITATASSGCTFAGWLGVPSETITSDVTIMALFMETDSDDEVVVETDTAKIVVEKIQGTTSIVSEIKTNEVEDVDVAISETLDKIAEVQKTSESSSQTVVVQVVVPVSGEEGTLEISSTTVTKLMDTGAELTVNNGGTTVSLETKVLETLANESAKQPGDTLSIVVTPDTKKLNDKQKTVVGQNQAVDVSAYLGEKKISDLGGTAKISVPYQTNNKVKVTYVMDDGTTENVDCIYADGVVSFTTTHFSVYMISEVKSPSFIIIPDTSQDDFLGYVPTPSSDATDSGSGDTAKIAVLIGAIVVLLVAMVALTHKSR